MTSRKKWKIEMLNKSLLKITVLAPLMLPTTAFAQTTSTVDPACMIKSDDGTQVVDKVKCPDGKKMGAAAQLPADTTQKAEETAKSPDITSKSSADAAKVPDDTATTTASAVTSKAVTDLTVTGSTSMAKGDILVSPNKMTGAKILSANDFIGKTVYSRADEKVGKVDDLILSENGVQAVVLGVGGFLGLGTKDVAVNLNSIDISKDGNATKLVVDATKDQLKAAPTYDPKVRTYMN